MEKAPGRRQEQRLLHEIKAEQFEEIDVETRCDDGVIDGNTDGSCNSQGTKPLSRPVISSQLPITSENAAT